jgi:hypothetical protein
LSRLLSTAFCVALLAATAGAFALTERAKLQLSPIFQTKIVPQKIFSPDCNCPTSSVQLVFRLRKSDTLTVWMEHDGARVATLVSNHHYPKGQVKLDFDGVDDSGTTLPDGVYKPVVHFHREHLTLHLPQPAWVLLDTKPPVIHVRHRIYTHISPDGDGRNDSFHVPYTLSEPGHGILRVNGRRVEFTRGLTLSGVLKWDGKLRNEPAPPGNYVLSVSAQDAAGNRAKPFPIAVVTVRYIELGRTRILVKPGARFAVGVHTDAASYSWLFERATGTTHERSLRLHAPKKKGVYRLYVQERGHAARALVVVG